MINKITIKNNVRIIDNKYVIKERKKDLDSTFNYLLSRSFNYFPEIIKEDNKYIYYKYIEDIYEPKGQKIIDLIILLSILHNKTTFYKEVDIDYYKYIYESINKKIDETYNYYNNLMDNIELSTYMSPSNYLLARNISSIYNSLVYAKENINSWYKLVEPIHKVRVATIHNNLKLSHYLKSDRSYLISWDNSTIDMPIYDLISLYKNNYQDFEFTDLLNIYLNKYPLKEDEMTLFLTIISIPDTIKFNNNEYKNVINTRNIIDYVNKTSSLRKEYSITKKHDKK